MSDNEAKEKLVDLVVENVKDKRLILIRGIPGSGKSTFAKSIMKKADGVKREIFEADQFFMKSGKYDWNPSKIADAHKDCFERMKWFLSSNEKAEAIVANTFTTKKELEPYLKYASENKIDVTIFRMENRFDNIHSVPDSTINKMLSRFQSISGEIIIKEKNV